MSVDKLLQDLNHGEDNKRTRYLINWLSSYMTQLIEDGMPFNVFNRSLPIHRNLIQFINKITDDFYRENEARLLDYLSDETKFNDFKNRVYSQLKSIKHQTAEACTEALDMISTCGMSDMVKTHVSNGLRKWASKGYVSDGYSQSMANAMDDITTAYKKPKKDSPHPPTSLTESLPKPSTW